MEKPEKLDIAEIKWNGGEKRRYIRADEVFSLFMKYFLHPDIKTIITEFIKRDSRKLSELTEWLLKSRGYSKLINGKGGTLHYDRTFWLNSAHYGAVCFDFKKILNTIFKRAIIVKMSENSQLIAEYAKNPVNRYEMGDFSISHNEESRVCGDTVKVFLKIENLIVKEYSFIGDTSIITTASASIFGESIQGLRVDEILDYNLEYIVSLIGEVSPKRRHAATLALLATRNAIHEYLKDGKIDDFSDVLE